MKKIISISLIILCVIATIVPTAYAEDNFQYDSLDVVTETEYFDDGSYIVTTIRQTPTARASTYTKHGEKVVELFNSSDELQWTYILTGTFQVTAGVSAVCTNSTYSVEITDSNWHLTAHDNSYSGNTAYGTATIKKKVLFITTNTYDIDASVSCDADGNIR